MFCFPWTVKINDNEGECCQNCWEQTEKVRISNKQKSLEFIMLVRANCYSFCKTDKVVSWLFVNYLELVNTFFLGCLNSTKNYIKFSRVFASFAISQSQRDSDPWIKHNKLNLNIWGNVWFPSLGSLIEFLNLSFKIKLFSNIEQSLLSFSIFSKVCHWIYSNLAILL